MVDMSSFNHSQIRFQFSDRLPQTEAFRATIWTENALLSVLLVCFCSVHHRVLSGTWCWKFEIYSNLIATMRSISYLLGVDAAIRRCWCENMILMQCILNDTIRVILGDFCNRYFTGTGIKCLLNFLKCLAVKSWNKWGWNPKSSQ